MLIVILSITGFFALFILSLWTTYKLNVFSRTIVQLDDLKKKNEEQSRLTDDLIRKVSQENYEKFIDRLGNTQLQQQRGLSEFKETIQKSLNDHRAQFDERQLQSLKILQDSLQTGMSETRQEVKTSLLQHTEELNKGVQKLTQDTDQRLREISGQVEKRLSEGFEKTTATFTDVVKRLALIDEAQKKITELSTNVVSLQEVLSDKRSRGAFGETQLSMLISNMLPEKSYSMQYTLSNGKRADCILFLPEPTGDVVIDSKFPLESYRRMTDVSINESDRSQSEKQFKLDIKKHIHDISDKYIIPGETSDGAVMFIPAEAVFAEIHGHYPDLVENAQRARVWMVSPTTMMAILTTAKAVLKDEATRQQVHIIRDHLSVLAKDFDRFQVRMDSLAKHVKQAHEDVEDVNISAKKITSRFNKIEKVELKSDNDLEQLDVIPNEDG